MKKIKIKSQQFILDPSGALYWKEKESLLIADVHLGKVAHFRKNGVAVPRKAEGAFYKKIAALYTKFSIQRIIFLGDLFHSFQNNEWHLFETWIKKQSIKVMLIEGNHDVIPNWKFKKLGIDVKEYFKEEDFYFSHFPIDKENYFVFCGHVHPGVKLKGAGLQELKLPCFFQSKNQLILPAFGAFTGLHLLTPNEQHQVYVITGKEVMKIKGT